MQVCASLHLRVGHGGCKCAKEKEGMTVWSSNSGADDQSTMSARYCALALACTFLCLCIAVLDVCFALQHCILQGSAPYFQGCGLRSLHMHEVLLQYSNKGQLQLQAVQQLTCLLNLAISLSLALNRFCRLRSSDSADSSCCADK